MTNIGYVLANLAFFAVLAIIYFIPAFIAARRRIRSATALLAVNVFAGWTIAGWFAVLFWALLGERENDNWTPPRRDRPSETR
ncbi:MAG: superinfection immunity protein [Alphaproteobacteria bacterium]|nr:superinfection immunity protein [Alphaproteobacteria bacterium]MBL7097192.1 superinfection immunity protein [Alphaproteobacteria bacterium]